MSGEKILKAIKLFSLVLIALLSMSVNSASQQTATLSWNPPTTRIDGSVLDSADIAGYNVYYNIDADVTGTESPIKIAPGASTVLTFTLAPRAAPYVINFKVSAFVVGVLNGVPDQEIEGELSNQASKSYIVQSNERPTAPTDLIFQLKCETAGCTIIEVQ